MTEVSADQTEARDAWPLYAYPLDPRRSLDESVGIIAEMANPSAATMAKLERALSLIDRDSLRALIERHDHHFDALDPVAQYKFADVAIWTYRMVVLAEQIGLDRSTPLKLLDIGAGSGALALVARSMGHDVIAADVENPWYDELCRLHGVERHIAPVRRGEPYQVNGGPFDLITAIQVTFHRQSRKDKSRDYWTNADWSAFVTDVAHNLLADDGRIILTLPLDKGPDGALSPPAALGWFEEQGARLGSNFDGGRVCLVELDAATSRHLGCTRGG